MMTVSPSLISGDVIVRFGKTVEIMQREIVSIQAGRFSIVYIKRRGSVYNCMYFSGKSVDNHC